MILFAIDPTMPQPNILTTDALTASPLSPLKRTRLYTVLVFYGACNQVTLTSIGRLSTPSQQAALN
jgi:hypothetical protein